MDSINEIEYNVRKLPTRSVTLFPTRAKVWRDIKDISLKPGTNKITVIGLSPTVEEDSIRVEGSGTSSASITDIAVEPLPNREVFEDVYPEADSSSSEEESDSESDDDEVDSDREGEELEKAREQLTEVLDRLDMAKESVASATWRLKILDAHGKSVPGKKNIDIEQFLNSCKAQRSRACDEQLEGIRRQRIIAKEVDDARSKVRQLERKERNEKSKARKEEDKKRKEKRKQRQLKAKERSKKERAKKEQRKDEARIRMEREKFWPRYCYSVSITLEVNTYTPLASRRSSIASEVTIAKDPGFRKPEDDGAAAGEETAKFDLLISYVTGSAGWEPCYDLQMSTTDATGVLCFDAQIRNMTSETWSNCLFTLSTSQTAFFERQSSIPTLPPWHIRIAPKGTTVPANSILRSREELSFHAQWQSWQKTAPMGEPRAQLFGVSNDSGGRGFGGFAGRRRDEIRKLIDDEDALRKQAQVATSNYYNPGQFNKASVGNTNTSGFGGFGAAPPAQQQAGLFSDANKETFAAPKAITNKANLTFGARPDDGLGSYTNAAPPAPGAVLARGGFGQVSDGLSAWGAAGADDECQEVSEKSGAGEPAQPPVASEADLGQSLDLEDSLIDETGFTTTFDLTGASSLAPRSTTPKRRVARISFSNVTLSHIVVAKFKPVAFLKASFRNTSKLTLLRGQATLVLDGSFMGRATVPRCSAGDRFSLSLGADPAIKVVYPKPDVRRATTGLFNRENSSVYVRTISLHNTKASAGKATSLLVLDQVPVSEDERLRVEVVSPRGLAMEGGSVPIHGKQSDGKEDKSWGEATAEIKKSGEVNWHVMLNAGKTVKLSLEYAVSLPSGENAIQN
ncbi:hypothetical protein K4F52_004393 [Lecanicillium sp. MT-2017a]|nr:hypothetical protein K4F52_004393 [Lecanicillium sp. MT-2017a]